MKKIALILMSVWTVVYACESTPSSSGNKKVHKRGPSVYDPSLGRVLGEETVTHANNTASLSQSEKKKLEQEGAQTPRELGKGWEAQFHASQKKKARVPAVATARRATESKKAWSMPPIIEDVEDESGACGCCCFSRK